MKKITFEDIMIILAGLAVIILVFWGLLKYTNNKQQAGISQPNQTDEEESYINPEESKSESEEESVSRRNEELNPDIDYAYGGPEELGPAVVKEADAVWEINKKQSQIISLGRYRISIPKYTVLDVTKLWLYFFSDSLSQRDDELYGLQSSYVSKLILKINDKEKEIKVGGSEYMLIELPDYPLGDFYPYDKEVNLEFEFLIELKCSNLQNKTCLDNENKPLNYINNADIQPQIRIFAQGIQRFTKDISIDAIFKYR